MKSPLRKKDRKKIIQAAVFAALLFAVAAWVGEVSAGEIVLGVLLVALALHILLLHRQTEARAHQQEALMNLFAVLRPVAPLPDFERWSAMPDLLKKVLELVLTERPVTIVEAGSGTSTLVCAAALQKLGRGRVIALEHEAQYAEQTRSLLEMHGLATYAQVFHAPLTEQQIDGRALRWYDLGASGIAELESIDLLLIDGPPRLSGALARYPALPRLHRQLRDGACIVLDDADRKDEQEAVRQWLAQYPDLTARRLPLARGAVVLRKKARGAAQAAE